MSPKSIGPVGRPASTPPETAASATAPADGTPGLDTTYRRRPRQPRGQKRVELLLDAAAAVIAESGLQAATAEAIALRAKTAKGSLYQFFPNRDAVLAALALRYADQMRAIHERAIPMDSQGLSLERLIEQIVRPLAEFHDRNPAFRRVFAVNEGPSDDTRSTPVRLRSQLFDSFVDRLDLLFAARNPALPARDRRRLALICVSVGQAVLARRSRVAAAEKKPLLDDLQRLLVAYLAPVLVPTAPVSAPRAAPAKRASGPRKTSARAVVTPASHTTAD